jgi:hypothetical protein
MIEWPASPAGLGRMHDAAAIVVECRHRFAASPAGLLGEIAAGETALADWRHYPLGEVYDPQSHGQYFYHLHPAAERALGEHGHFHTFLRAEGMPPGVAPLVLPETAIADAPRPAPQAAPLKRGAHEEVSHLVAIALDHAGAPVRLFTTNRWVTGETWYRADDVVRLLDRFSIGEVGPSVLVNQWIVAMIALFRPQIAALLRARDETMLAWRRRRRTNVLEDPQVETMSSLDIDLDAHLAMLQRHALRADHDPWPQPPVLPRMAEGWGEERAG